MRENNGAAEVSRISKRRQLAGRDDPNPGPGHLLLVVRNESSHRRVDEFRISRLVGVPLGADLYDRRCRKQLRRRNEIPGQRCGAALVQCECVCVPRRSETRFRLGEGMRRRARSPYPGRRGTSCPHARSGWRRRHDSLAGRSLEIPPSRRGRAAGRRRDHTGGGIRRHVRHKSQRAHLPTVLCCHASDPDADNACSSQNACVIRDGFCKADSSAAGHPDASPTADRPDASFASARCRASSASGRCRAGSTAGRCCRRRSAASRRATRHCAEM